MKANNTEKKTEEDDKKQLNSYHYFPLNDDSEGSQSKGCMSPKTVLASPYTKYYKQDSFYDIYCDELEMNLDSEKASNMETQGNQTDLKKSFLKSKENYEVSNFHKLSCCERYFGPIKAGSLRGSTIAMASITLGGGCLSFPYAIAQSGPLVGFGMFIIIAIISYWTLELLLVNGLDSGTMDYNELAENSGGIWMKRIADYSNIGITIGLILSYQYIITNLCLQVLNYFFDTQCDGIVKILQIIICAVVFQIPLSMLKSISNLQYISLSGTVAICLAILIIIIESPFYAYEYFTNETKSDFSFFPPNNGIKTGWLDTLGILLFGFSSHNGIFQIFNELDRPGKRRCTKVLRRAFVLEGVLYLLLSFAGFFSTFYDTPDVFLKRKNLSGFEKDYFIIIVKILLVITLNSCMALNYNIMRMAYKSIFFNSKTPSFLKDTVLVIITYIITNLITYFLDNAGTLLSFLGGFCTVIVCFVIPIVVDLKINPNDVKKNKLRKTFNWIVLVVMCILGTICSVKALIDFITAKPSPPIC